MDGMQNISGQQGQVTEAGENLDLGQQGQVTEAGETVSQQDERKVDIGALFASAGASTGNGNPSLMDSFLPDYDFGGMRETFEGFVDSETGDNYASFLKAEAFKAGAKTKDEMDLFVRGASALANNLNLFNDEPLDTQIQKALLAYPKERQGNLQGIWNRATGSLDEKELQLFQEEIATDPKLLLIIDKMIGNSVQLNKVYAGANKGIVSSKYTIEQYAKDVRDDRYYSDPKFKAEVDAKAKKAGL